MDFTIEIVFKFWQIHSKLYNLEHNFRSKNDFQTVQSKMYSDFEI